MTRKSTRFTPTIRDYEKRAEVERETQHAGESRPRRSEPRTVRVVEYRPGGDQVVVEEFNAASFAAAQRAADEAQDVADRACQPRRAFVVDADGVAVDAARMTELGRAQETEAARWRRRW